MPENLEVIKLRREFDTHREEFEDYKETNNNKMEEYREMYENNMKAINALTESTQGVVDAWTFANQFHRFIKWLSAFGVLAATGAWFSNHWPFK